MNRPFWSLQSSPQNVCAAIEPLLSVYADGMASPAEVRQVDAHLPECETCRAALSFMQATRTVLASRPVAVPPPDLHSRIALAIAAASPAPVTLRPARVFTLRTAYAAAASVTVLGIALSYPLWHAPTEVAVKQPAKPAAVAIVPVRAVKPPFAPKTAVRPLVASNLGKPVVKHTIIVHSSTPMRVIAPKHIAANTSLTKQPVAPSITVKAPVHQAPLTQKIASRDIAPTEKHTIEKHAPLPAVKTAGPKPTNTQQIAKVSKEPTRVPFNIQTPKLTPDLPPVRVASTHEALSLRSDNILKSVVAHTEDMQKASLAAISVPVSRTTQEAMRLPHVLGGDDHTAFISAVHGNQ